MFGDRDYLRYELFAAASVPQLDKLTIAYFSEPQELLRPLALARPVDGENTHEDQYRGSLAALTAPLAMLALIRGRAIVVVAMPKFTRATAIRALAERETEPLGHGREPRTGHALSAVLWESAAWPPTRSTTRNCASREIRHTITLFRPGAEVGIDLSAMDEPHHRVVEEWMGQQVETLEDLLQPGLRAVCVGINPAPRSVRAGHYYQGRLGQKLFSRLHQAGVVPSGRTGWQDDEAFAAGVGFTDIVKRPTERASQVRPKEYEHGRKLLNAKLEQYRPRLAIFSFKDPAKKLFGSFSGNGFVSGLQLAHSDVFVMPGPYESASAASKTLSELAAYLR